MEIWGSWWSCECSCGQAYDEFSMSGEMESMRSEHWTENIWKKDLTKERGPHACMWSVEVVGLYKGSLLSQMNSLGYITRALSTLSACCWHNTIPRIEGTQEGFSNWHNSQALREKEKKKVLKFVSFQMFWNIARPTHKRKLAPTSEVRPYISLNCSHNS